MLKIFVMAIVFSVEILSSIVLAKPRVTVLEMDVQQNIEDATKLSDLASDLVDESLFNSGKFVVLVPYKYFDDLKEENPEYRNKILDADYIVISQLIIEPVSKKHKITHHIDFVQDDIVIWSDEVSRKVNLNKLNRNEKYNVVHKLTNKVMKKFFKSIDSGKIILKE